MKILGVENPPLNSSNNRLVWTSSLYPYVNSINQAGIQVDIAISSPSFCEHFLERASAAQFFTPFFTATGTTTQVILSSPSVAMELSIVDHLNVPNSFDQFG